MNLLARLINFFRPAPLLSEKTDPEAVKSDYNYWRWRIFVGMYVGYFFFYFARRSYPCIMPLLIDDLGFTKSDLGILGSIFALTYGLSKFVSGILADRANPRAIMGIGLLLTGFFNLLFGYTSSVLWFAILWGLAGWFQGWGWPPCAKLLTHWYSQKERGTWWGLWNSSHNAGGFACYLAVGVIAQYYGWRYGMLIPGLASIVAGFFLLFCLRDTPQSLGLPSIEKFKNDTSTTQPSEENLPMKEILFKYVLNNGYIWLLAFAYFFVYVIRGAINDWSPLFLMETRGYSLVTANMSGILFEVGGLAGSFVAGWLSDKLFAGRRGPINVLFSIAVIAGTLLLWLAPPGFLFLDYALIFALGFAIFGPQMLIGIAAAELSHKKAAGSATGFIGWIAYLGTASAGYPLGKIMESSGWNGCFITLLACSAIAVVLLLPLWAVKTHPRVTAVEVEERAEVAG